MIRPANTRQLVASLWEILVILIVTDHQKTRQVLPPLVAARGYRVAGIECGDELLKRVRFQVPSLVVLDCALPDSFEMIAKVRSDPRAVSVPVIMFTNASEDLREKALLKGADAYVPKGSLDWAELLVEVQRLAGPPPAGDNLSHVSNAR
jgi:CheY-like chemotaxis protein